MAPTLEPSDRYQLATPDGPTLEAFGWSPPEPRAALLLVHGIGEHCQRYGNLIQALLDRQITVLAYDLRGHGLSRGPRVFVDRFDTYLTDLDLAIGSALSRTAPLPLFLMGHSMGGTIVALHAIERAATPSPVRGRIVSSAAVQLGDDIPAWLQSISRFLGRVLPHMPTVKLDSAGLSRIAEVAEAYDADPLVNHKGTPARTGAELVEAMKRIQSGMGRISEPLLIRHGAADTLCLPAGSQLLYDGVASSDKTLAVYPDAYHELHNDLDRQANLADLANWIESRV